MDVVRDIALMAFGLGVLAAEVWLCFSSPGLAVVLMAMTIPTLLIVGSEIWEDYRPTY